MSDRKTWEKPVNRHEGPEHAAPYPVSRLAPPIQLVDLAREIEKADRMIATQVSSKLKVISEQIRQLQDQAREVLQKAGHDQDLHRVRCNFKRIPGKTYHLYVRENGGRYFSMLSPEDWQGDPPDSFIGTFRLEADLSWTPADRETDEKGRGELFPDLHSERKKR